MNLQPVEAKPDLSGTSGSGFNLRNEMRVESNLYDAPSFHEEFKTLLPVSQGDQAYESNNHPNHNTYYEESKEMMI